MRIGFQGRGLVSLQFAAFLVIPMVATSCSLGSSSPPSASTSGGTVTIATPDDWTTLDPTSGNVNGLTYPLAEAGYDRLLAIGPGGKMLPYLAKSWVQTPSSITFKLRT